MVQVPANGDHPSHALVAEVAGESPFRDALADAGDDGAAAVLAPERYAELLDELGFAEQRVRTEVYGHHLESTAAVVEWTKGSTLDARTNGCSPPISTPAFVERYREPRHRGPRRPRALLLHVQADPVLGTTARDRRRRREDRPMSTTTSLDSFGTRGRLDVGDRSYEIFRLGDLGGQLPYSLKVLLENLLRHEDGVNVTADDIEALAAWRGGAGERDREVGVRPARILWQDYTGVPAVADLAAMRDADRGARRRSRRASTR